MTETLPLRGRQDIVGTLDELNTRLGEYSEEFVVIGGANLVLRGLKSGAMDVDILVSNRAFSTMSGMPGAKIKLPPERAIARGATNNSVWLKTDWARVPISGAEEMGDGYFPMSYSMYEDVDLEQFGGHALAPLDDVWGSKLALQRPKDVLDLLLIAKATGRSIDFPPPIYQGNF